MTRIEQNVVDNAMLWAKGEECSPICQYDIVVLGEYLNVNIPSYFSKFEWSNSRDHIELNSKGCEELITKKIKLIQRMLLEK